MIDLTPLDVRKKRGDFRKILRGYDPGEVDTFLEMVEDRMEALVMENLALTERAERLSSQLEALEGREKAVQEALVTAQKLREDVQDQSRREATSVRDQVVREVEALREEAKRETEAQRGEAHRESSILRDEAIREAASVREQARRESDLLRREVTAEIEARILEAEGLITERQRALEELERSRRKFLKGFRTLLEREIDAVEVEEARRPLEDTPLELNLKGWNREEEDEGEEGEEEESAKEVTSGEEWGAEGSVPPDAFEPVIELDAPMGDGATEEAPGLGWGAMPGDEPPEGEFSDIVPVGVFEPHQPEDFATEVDGEEREPEDPGQGEDEALEGEKELEYAEAAGTDADFGSTLDQLLGADSGEDGSAGPEPLWLSSLLKQEGEEDSPSEEPAPDQIDEDEDEDFGDEEEEPRID